MSANSGGLSPCRSTGINFQVGQRRIAGAEIVHGQLRAHGLDLVQLVDRAQDIGDEGTLGDLQFEAMRRQAGQRQRIPHLVHEIGLA